MPSSKVQDQHGNIQDPGIIELVTRQILDFMNSRLIGDAYIDHDHNSTSDTKQEY